MLWLVNVWDPLVAGGLFWMATAAAEPTITKATTRNASAADDTPLLFIVRGILTP